MRFACSWLADYVELPGDGPAAAAAELQERLTAAGLAVEYVEQREGETLLDVDVTTNRVDAMNHFGVAREISALYDRELRFPASDPEESGAPAGELSRVLIDDSRCPRYVARVIRGVRVGPSPEWLVRRLESIGARPINNVVDVTNYVLWELGQPLHAFDWATLGGATQGEATIRVRAARPGEELVTLDGERRLLDPEVMVIADAERAVALAGIMGGLDTEVTGRTTDVLLESAHFDPRTVRRGARRFGLHTDASHRFERGADPEVCARAASRAARLIAEVAGGTVAPGVLDVRHPQAPSYELFGRLEHRRLEAFMGLAVDPADVERWLSRLGFELTADGEGAWRARVPSWRYYDFQTPRPDGDAWEADLFEEVARLHGFDAVPATLPVLDGVEPPPTAAQIGRRRVADHLVACGYAEAVTFAFGDPAEAARFPALRDGGAPLALANPLSERYSVMRRSLLPGLVESARFNQRRGAEVVRLFEIGRVFFPTAPGELPDEVEALALVAGGTTGSPWQRQVELDYFDLKGVLESLAELSGVTLEARPAQLTGMLTGVAASLYAGGEPVGYVGRLDGDGPYPLYAAELGLAALGRGEAVGVVEMPSRHPGVAVDLTFTHPLELPWAEVRRAIEERRPADLAAFGLKDRYTGPGVPPGAVNTTLSFHYNAADRSLTQEEVNARHRGLAAELECRFGWREEESDG